MRSEYEPDVSRANSQLDKLWLVMQQVTGHCFLKGKTIFCHACPAWEWCDAKNKEERHAV